MDQIYFPRNTINMKKILHFKGMAGFVKQTMSLFLQQRL